MTNPITLLVRHLSLRRNKVTVEHSILPLSKIRRAVVFVDAFPSNSEKTKSSIKLFFAEKRIEVHILDNSKYKLNAAKFLKRKVRNAFNRNEDLYISLIADPKCYAAEYEAKCSKAKFKIGLCDYDENIFDIVFSSTNKNRKNQLESFDEIKSFLNKIV